MRQFSTMCFQMLPQIAFLRGCGVTLVAFALFSTVRFEMSLQVACIRGRIVTLVAFVCVFFTVVSQMCFQIACMRGNMRPSNICKSDAVQFYKKCLLCHFIVSRLHSLVATGFNWPTLSLSSLSLSTLSLSTLSLSTLFLSTLSFLAHPVLGKLAGFTLEPASKQNRYGIH